MGNDTQGLNGGLVAVVEWLFRFFQQHRQRNGPRGGCLEDKIVDSGGKKNVAAGGKIKSSTTLK